MYILTNDRSTDCGGYEIDDDESEDVFAELAEVQIFHCRTDTIVIVLSAQQLQLLFTTADFAVDADGATATATTKSCYSVCMAIDSVLRSSDSSMPL
jgi:hypothetical protein